MTSDEMMDFEDFPDDTFALGSSQYSGIYKKYRWLTETEKVKDERFNSMVNYRQTLTDFFEEIIPAFGEIMLERAKEWEEEPQMEYWNSLDFKLKLLVAKESVAYDLQKRMLIDLLDIMKRQSWDLWSALKFINLRYPELSEFVEDNFKDEYVETNEGYAAMIYFFASILGMDDDEVRETFGDFDT